MSKFKHTPGPWKFDYQLNNKVLVIYHKYTDLFRGFSANGKAEHNAMITCAAPDMLNVLIDMCNGNCDNSDVVCNKSKCKTCGLREAKLVIEKATNMKIKDAIKARHSQ